jgi:hypothetical protein
MKVYTREKYIFWGCKVLVGMTAGVQNEFRSQNFQVFYLENGAFGDHYNLTLAPITRR